MENNFIKASRLGLRFETNRNGFITVEDLWSLSLIDLDRVAIAVNKKLKESKEESFIVKRTTGNTELELKLEILKYIITTKQEETTRSKLASVKRAELATLKDLLESKKTDELKSLDTKSLEERIAALEVEIV